MNEYEQFCLYRVDKNTDRMQFYCGHSLAVKVIFASIWTKKKSEKDEKKEDGLLPRPVA